jgi:hypothetical protein
MFNVRKDIRVKVWFSVRDQFVKKYGWQTWEKYKAEFQKVGMGICYSKGHTFWKQFHGYRD